MVQDARWPALPLLVIRGVQFFFAILVLGMSGYLVSTDHDSLKVVLIQNTPMSILDYTLTVWGFSMALAAAVFTLVYVGIVFVLFFANLLLPLAVVIVDAVLTVFWVVALGGLGATKLLPEKCTYSFLEVRILSYDIVTRTSNPCRVIKADFGVSFLIFLSFLGTLALASIILHKNRKDLRGAKHNSGIDPEGSPLPQANVSVAMGNAQGVAEGAYYQEPKPTYAPTPQAMPVYYNYQPPVSPPVSPAPYMRPQGVPPQGMQPQGMPQPPPAAEMPGR